VFDERAVDSNGRWLLSGKMIVEFKPSSGVSKGLEIEVPFSNAANEREAAQQGCGASSTNLR
jgi:hypothetical protein